MEQIALKQRLNLRIRKHDVFVRDLCRLVALRGTDRALESRLRRDDSREVSHREPDDRNHDHSQNDSRSLHRTLLSFPTSRRSGELCCFAIRSVTNTGLADKGW